MSQHQTPVFTFWNMLFCNIIRNTIQYNKIKKLLPEASFTSDKIKTREAQEKRLLYRSQKQQWTMVLYGICALLLVCVEGEFCLFFLLFLVYWGVIDTVHRSICMFLKLITIKLKNTSGTRVFLFIFVCTSFLPPITSPIPKQPPIFFLFREVILKFFKRMLHK